MERLIRSILLKRNFRSDALWTSAFARKRFLKMIPLFADTFALLKSQYWPREKLERLQDERLRSLFAAARNVPFWRNLFDARGIAPSLSPREMLARIPVIAKGEFVRRQVSEITDASLVEGSAADHTSGSTGKPFHFYQDRGAELRSCAVTERIFRATGKRHPIVYVRARQRHGFTFYRHIWFYMRGYTSVRYRMDEFAKLGERFPRGFILYGYTSWIVEIARYMEARDMTLPIRAVMVAGEHLTDADREYLRRVMRADVFTLYASRETGFLGFECERHRMHVCEEWALIEIVDEHGKPLPDGREGRIAVTTFDNRVMPFIRYEIGDIGTLSDEPCPCGRTLRTLTFKGRTAERIELDDDRVVSLLDIAYVLGSVRDAVRHYQIVQTQRMRFVMRVVPGPSFAENQELLEGLMVRLLHPRVSLQWDVVESISEAASGKAAYFIRDF